MLGVIINPKSGKRAYRMQRMYLWNLLRERKIAYEFRVTKYAAHATELARELVEDFHCDEILVLGGESRLKIHEDDLINHELPFYRSAGAGQDRLGI